MLSNQSYDIKSYIKQELIDVSLALFKKFDKGGKGFIDTKDLGTMLRLLDFNPTEKEIKGMISRLVDETNSDTGQVSKEGFLVCVAQKSRESDTIEELLSAFKVFDKEGKGLIEEKHMRYILCKLGEGLNDEEMDLFIKEASSNFVVLVDDTKFIKYPDLALYFKDMYVPQVVEDKKSKQKGRGK